jgi:hypothetical protein
LVLLLLLEIKKAEQNPPKAALLTRIMAEVTIQPKHRLVCVRMAVNKNLEARNYKVTARLIKVNSLQPVTHCLENFTPKSC